MYVNLNCPFPFKKSLEIKEEMSLLKFKTFEQAKGYTCKALYAGRNVLIKCPY